MTAANPSSSSSVVSCNDVDEGRPIRVRYRWSHITERAAHWEQAFSLDEGATWETNWITELRRVSSDSRDQVD